MWTVSLGLRSGEKPKPGQASEIPEVFRRPNLSDRIPEAPPPVQDHDVCSGPNKMDMEAPQESWIGPGDRLW